MELFSVPLPVAIGTLLIGLLIAALLMRKRGGEGSKASGAAPSASHAAGANGALVSWDWQRRAWGRCRDIAAVA